MKVSNYSRVFADSFIAHYQEGKSWQQSVCYGHDMAMKQLGVKAQPVSLPYLAQQANLSGITLPPTFTRGLL